MNTDAARAQALIDRQNAIMRRNGTQAAHWINDNRAFCFTLVICLMAVIEIAWIMS